MQFLNQALHIPGSLLTRSTLAYRQQGAVACYPLSPKTPGTEPRTCRNTAAMDRPVITRQLLNSIFTGPAVNKYLLFPAVIWYDILKQNRCVICFNEFRFTVWSEYNARLYPHCHEGGVW